MFMAWHYFIVMHVPDHKWMHVHNIIKRNSTIGLFDVMQYHVYQCVRNAQLQLQMLYK